MKINNKPLLATKRTCTGCMACSDACNSNALNMIVASDGHYYPKLNLDNCTNCGLCTKVCPIVSKFDYQSIENISRPYAAWANDDSIRMSSSSGGIFAPIAYHTIKNGGYVAGAIMDGISVKHILTNKAEDIIQMQGSKYQQADSMGVYNAVREKLKDGKFVFFTGVPCQVAALYSFLGKYGKSELLLTSDLACSGFPTSLLLKKFIEEKIGKDVENESKNIFISYRSKDKGWKKSQKFFVSYHSKDEEWDKSKKSLETDYGLNNFVYNGFLSGTTQRYSCSDCKFALLQRKADLTLADFWKDKRFPEEHYKGISCVVAHSERGRTILTKNVYFTFHQVKWADFIPYNKLVYHKLPFLKVHPARVFMAFNFKHLPFSILEKIYGKKINMNDVLWLPYKIFNLVIFKIRTRKREKYKTMFLKKNINEKN